MNQGIFLDIYVGVFANMAGSFLYSHLIKHDLISLDTFLISTSIAVCFSLIVGPRIRNDAW
jgi:uncharacterized membrane protein YeaQ/YmgE (transglycosylase-associated protein family)